MYPEWDTAAKIEDTLVWAKIVCPKDALKSGDFARFRRGKLPGSLIGRYSLEAFGHRLGNYKGDYDGGWDAWSKEMHDYCAQDVEVNYNPGLFPHLKLPPALTC